MTDNLVDLVSNHGALVVLVSTFLSCLFVPIPSCLVMLAAGAFVAAGDLEILNVAGAAFCGAVLGDQVGYRIGRAGGDAAIGRLSRHPARARLVQRAQTAFDRHGGLAVFFSTWAVAQVGPCVNVVAGAARLSPLRFTLWDAAGEAIWVAIYVGAGYVFAAQLEAATEIIGNATGFLAAGAVTVLLGLWLRVAVRRDPN